MRARHYGVKLKKPEKVATAAAAAAAAAGQPALAAPQPPRLLFDPVCQPTRRDLPPSRLDRIPPPPRPGPNAPQSGIFRALCVFHTYATIDDPLR